ncbi:hypothetical protein jhhlp_005296 [Lomentospora prolificans]|uniref:Calcineurin-like phosphoesterase domain-containing protein n=1 Tax=Lomentospora prolificans TaxID=41688 RepID=A0A2N3N7J5_9PEZI|nr:hypothetical protein jhhlp_005296 [Lomentospora prolificans]
MLIATSSPWPIISSSSPSSLPNLYPIFRVALPTPHDARSAFLDTASRHVPQLEANYAQRRAPFRLLTLGDPQLEGDTSIPNVYLGVMPHFKKLVRQVTGKTKHYSLRQRVRAIVHSLVDIYFEDIPNEFESLRKRIDHFGNDFYLAHIYRTLDWWTIPTHATVLGDLLGSQWIDDKEFERRGKRFWHRVFAGAERVSDELAQYPADEYDISGYLGDYQPESGDNSTWELENPAAWRRRLINVAGNHDIGYAGDLTEERLARFERVFGKANYELRFELPVTDPVLNASLFDEEANINSDRLVPELRIVVLNDMNLDTPAISGTLQDATYKFINDVINTASAVEFQGHFTLILTHIPMYKPDGVCVDSPFFDFHTEADGGGVKEQNLLSDVASKGLLEGILGLSASEYAAGGGMGRRGLVVNGHDHAGCDTYHFVNQTNGTVAADRSWEVLRFPEADTRGVPGKAKHPGVREITVRSMMGNFHGNAGLLSMWFDEDDWSWKYEYAECRLGTPLAWWLVHILDLVVVVGLVLRLALAVTGLSLEEKRTVERREASGQSAGRTGKKL